MSAIPSFSNNLFLQPGIPGLGGTNLSTATTLAGLNPQSLLGGAFTSNPGLSSILSTLQVGMQPGYPGLYYPGGVDSFAPVGGQPNIFTSVPVGAPPTPGLPNTPPLPALTAPGTPAAPGTPGTPEPTSGTPPAPGIPATPEATPTPPPVPGAGSSPTVPNGQTLQEIQAKALAAQQAQAQLPPPVGPAPGGNLLMPPTGGLPPTLGTPGGINPLMTPSPLGTNPLLGGGNPLLGGGNPLSALFGGGGAAGNPLFQMLAQLLTVLQQQQLAPGAPGAPGVPGAPVDPEKDALLKRIDELEKKLEAKELKEVNKANEEDDDPPPAKEKAPAKEPAPADKAPAKEPDPPAKEPPPKPANLTSAEIVAYVDKYVDLKYAGSITSNELQKAIVESAPGGKNPDSSIFLQLNALLGEFSKRDINGDGYLEVSGNTFK